MHLQHVSTTSALGVWEIDLLIINGEKVKRYQYYLRSQFAVERFNMLYRKGKKFHGRALAVLNKFKVKEET